MQQKFDHRDFIASLSLKQRQFLNERNNSKGLLAATIHFSAIAIFAALIILEIPGWQIIMIPQGILLVFTFTLLHETVHMTPFKSQWLNVFFGKICGFLIFLPPQWFKFFHLAHHRYTQDPQRDPELASPKPETIRQYLFYLTGFSVWKSHLNVLFNNAGGKNIDEFVPKRAKAKVVRESQIFVFIYAVIVLVSFQFSFSTIIYIWLIPLLLGQPFLRLYLLAEHGRCPYVSNMLENTRTTFTNMLVKKLAWNMPYHCEHHSYPSVPFHKLPDLNRLMNEHVAIKQEGFLNFHKDYVKFLDRS